MSWRELKDRAALFGDQSVEGDRAHWPRDRINELC